VEDTEVGENTRWGKIEVWERGFRKETPRRDILEGEGAGKRRELFYAEQFGTNFGVGSPEGNQERSPNKREEEIER